MTVAGIPTGDVHASMIDLHAIEFQIDHAQLTMMQPSNFFVLSFGYVLWDGPGVYGHEEGQIWARCELGGLFRT
jgi:hypothetical protein